MLTDKPVFFDASGKRSRWTNRSLVVLILALILAISIFVATVIDIPLPTPLALSIERSELRPIDSTPRKDARIKRGDGGFRLVKDRVVDPKQTKASLKIGFYVPGDASSGASLSAHFEALDWLVPSLISVVGSNHVMTKTRDARLEGLLRSGEKQPLILPSVQNLFDDDWDSDGAAALLHVPEARAAFLTRLERDLVSERVSGVVFDFEQLPETASADYLILLKEAKARFAARHWVTAVTAPADAADPTLKALAAVADHVFILAHDLGSTGRAAGPIARAAWFNQHVPRAVAAVGADKAIVAIGSYAVDWAATGDAEQVEVEEAWLTARDSDASISFDAQSGNAHFAYEEDGNIHQVWMLDAASAWNQMQVVRKSGASGLAIWRLGSDDPAVWTEMAAYQTGLLPDLKVIHSIGNVDVEGNGEILRIEASPSDGGRTLTQDAGGLVFNERYWSLPTPYVVRRMGSKPGYVALTFDDGPDPEWTPQILSVLKDKHVPATFFIIGQNALTHPFLLNQIIDEGSEIGSHTFTHPNLALVSPKSAQLELNITRRLVEAYTGRSVRLFRAPYFSDAEASTADELTAALAAQKNGYTNIGLHVDPHDWRREGAAAIAADTIAQVESATTENTQQIVLLHDGGGDRAQTVEALPIIIDRLKAKGYRFVPVSALAGLRKDDVMPKVGSADLFAARANIGLFLLVAGVGILLKWLFFAAISLGIARALIITALALNANRKSRRVEPPHFDTDRFVSVLIPAHNEARVIEASIRRVLASTHTSLEVIVVDDGSKDGTGKIVETAFGGNPSVHVLRIRNVGKARALNRAIGLARGDILIALDADTQFEPDTIAKLVRWFRDPEIGAVAGNVKVGNKVNLVTRWQALEYVTAQNLERRALSRFDAIMVVPGAVGAFLRSALDEVDGYPADTLAEDQDLTIRVQRNGWKVIYDEDAIAWTEAPESYSALATQRFRWAFGTLQCLWKHRSILRTLKPRGLALVGIPQTWIFQIGFALIAPFIDLTLLINLLTTGLKIYQHGWAQSEHDVLYMARFWLAFTTIDVACGYVAYRLEPREKHYPALLLIAQRFIYRQIMYLVVIRAAISALRGPKVGWGALTRSGTVGRPRKRKARKSASAA
jgi:peptidoglycan-N-acetylglucosamine deacetylase